MGFGTASANVLLQWLCESAHCLAGAHLYEKPRVAWSKMPWAFKDISLLPFIKSLSGRNVKDILLIVVV
jgi:hypothetical protein